MNNKIGDIIKCEVTGITDYGIFVKIDEEYSGLIHISEISNKFINSISKLYIEGDIIEAKIIEIDEEKKQMKLSIKQLGKRTKKDKAIEENGKGFEPLKENLEKWVEDKLKELEK